MVSTDDWSTTPASNTSVDGVNIAENCPPGNLNNAIRSVMAGVKSKVDDIDASIPVLDPTLSAIAVLVGVADTFAYFSGTDVAALAALTPFARTLLDDADAATMASTIGAVRVLASSLANPGYLKLQIGAGQFFIQWGSATFNGNGYTTITYPTPFSSFSIPIVSGAALNTSAQDNNPGSATSGKTSFTAFTATDGAVAGFWLAVGS